MKKKLLIIPNWLLGLIITIPLLVGMLSEYPPLHALDLKAYDLLTMLRQRDLPSPVVIVEIDRKSIDEIGPWPWPRSYMADIVSIISEARAKAIGLNILYQGKRLNPALQEIRKIRRSLANIPGSDGNIARANDLLGKISKKIDYDSLLISAVKPAQNVVLSMQFSWLLTKSQPAEIPGWLTRNNIEQKQSPLTSEQLIRELQNPLLALKDVRQPTSMRVPFDDLAAVAGRYGHINHQPDSDGAIRQESLIINYQNQLFPSLALQMAMAYDDHKFSDIKLIRDHNINKAIQYSKKRLATSHDFKMLIDYNDSPFVISRLSFSDVLNDKITKGTLEDKLVLIGITDPDLTRIYKTPIGLDKSGVEITAETVENIVNNSFIQRPSWAWFLECLVLLYFGIILLYINDRLNASTSLMILGTFLCGWLGLTAFLFINNGLWFYIAPHTLAICLGFGLQRLNHLQAASGKKVDEHTEMNKMLGLSFQAQGLLDMAFDSFRKCSLNDGAVKEALYNLALDFERKRMFNKAISVYEYLLKGGKHKDAHDRIWRLRRAESKT
ncbi:MAG: CHASE2 domain-containing protein, partial [Desulfobulbaceae bacterium]|nr:CHASE2 domain-containing protein [Desulfobulbaceae bacterium]